MYSTHALYLLTSCDSLLTYLLCWKPADPPKCGWKLPEKVSYLKADGTVEGHDQKTENGHSSAEREKTGNRYNFKLYTNKC